MGNAVRKMEIVEDGGYTCLLQKLLANDGRPFEARLACVLKGETFSLRSDIRQMLQVHLDAFGRSASFVSRAEFGVYRARIVQELLGGRKLPDMGRKAPELMFIGAMLVLLGPDSPDYEAYRKEWNTRVQRHSVIA